MAPVVRGVTAVVMGVAAVTVKVKVIAVVMLMTAAKTRRRSESRTAHQDMLMHRLETGIRNIITKTNINIEN